MAPAGRKFFVMSFEGPTSEQRVLLVDDEKTVREVVSRYLERDGFVVRELDNGSAVADAVERFRPDLLVLDIMLPGRNGLDILRDLRLKSRVPVILLTARVDEADRVAGLELGADDYVVKPFSARELVARIRSVLRRTIPIELETPTASRFSELHIDHSSRETRVNGNLVSLTAKEFDLLSFFARHPKQVFTRAQLLDQVWNSSLEFQDAATVTVHVRRLRNKLEGDPNNPKWITTVFGVGYRFEPA